MAASDIQERRLITTSRRIFNFAGGFFTGLVLIPVALVCVAGIAALLLSRLPGGHSPPAGPRVLTTSGADISRAGGAAILVRRLGDRLRQDCRDTCDDLRFENEGSSVDAVRVLDVRGGCVACRDLSQPYESAPTAKRLTVSGAPLSIAGAARE